MIKNFKRITALLLVLAMVFSLCACGKKESGYYEDVPTDVNIEASITVFAPVDSILAVATIINHYHSQAPGVEVKVNYDNAATLASKLEAGEECDIFVSDDPAVVERLAGKLDANTKKDIFSCKTEIDGAEVTKNFTFALTSTCQNTNAANALVDFFKTQNAKDVYTEFEYTFIE